MKMLSCKAMGDETCDFVAKGDTDQHVIDHMKAHIKEKHPSVLEGANMEEMHTKMVSKIETE